MEIVTDNGGPTYIDSGAYSVLKYALYMESYITIYNSYVSWSLVTTPQTANREIIDRSFLVLNYHL